MHYHTHDNKEKNLIITIILNILITLTEIIGGIISGSLALLSDAFHNFSDVISLLISYIALKISKKEKDKKRTFGYKRAEIIAAFLNILTLFFICLYIIYESIKRIWEPIVINANLMFIISFIGLLGNGVSILVLFKNSKHSLNIKSAFLHLLTDTLSSVAVVFISVILMFKKIYILDTILSIGIALFILKESFSIFFKTLNILMQSAPENLSEDIIINRLISDDSLKIKDIHHVHIWMLSQNEIIFDAHIVISKNDLTNTDYLITKINKILKQEFNICHSTLQIESNILNHSYECEL